MKEVFLEPGVQDDRMQVVLYLIAPSVVCMTAVAPWGQPVDNLIWSMVAKLGP